MIAFSPSELLRPARWRGALGIGLLCLNLTACEQIAELDGSKAAEADGKAVGGACGHAGRALEDCYALNDKAPKAAVFNGWREMNDYMTQNKIDVVPPQVPKKVKVKDETPDAKHAAPGAKPGGATKAPPLPNPLLSPLPVPPAPGAAPTVLGGAPNLQGVKLGDATDLQSR